ncbi:MAG: response regulator [Gemmatimonadetes bacterium]|nr:response regulator [Gemmatimonadota bacterium]
MMAPAQGPRPIDVLFVDDDAAVCASMSRCLQRVGFQVRVASSGVEALAAVSERRPDVVVTDHRMPKMSGSELIVRLVALDPTLRNRIILTSGDLMGDEGRTLATAGGRGLAKPYSAGELSLAIRAAATEATVPLSPV